MNFRFVFTFLFIASAFFIFNPSYVSAQEQIQETLEEQVIEVVSEKPVESGLGGYIVQGLGFELYKRAMNVGHDHIVSTVNTLVLVYTGVSLPLLLLFLITTASITEILNYEIIAEEIVRMLVSSIGLILSVPITTALAVKFAVGLEDNRHH